MDKELFQFWDQEEVEGSSDPRSWIKNLQPSNIVMEKNNHHLIQYMGRNVHEKQEQCECDTTGECQHSD